MTPSSFHSDMSPNRRTLLFGIGTGLAFGVVRYITHFYLSDNIESSFSWPVGRCAILVICLLVMVLRQPRLAIGRMSLLPLFVSLVELFYVYLYSHTIAGPGWNWRLCFWVALNWIHYSALIGGWATLTWSWNQDEKTSYVLLGALYMLLVAWLFPFEMAFRWADMMYCPGFGPF